MRVVSVFYISYDNVHPGFSAVSAAFFSLCSLTSYFWVFACESSNTALARLSHRNSVRLSVCLSVRPSHGWISPKRCKLGSQNLQYWLPGRL